MNRRKVLSIDGGGIKGVFPAAFLACVEEHLDRPIGEYFDLIVGTSTGGILALGLALGFSARELLGFYEDLGPRVFSGNSLLRRLMGLARPKYEPGPLKTVLSARFGDSKIADCKTRVVIPSMNLDTGSVHLFKTPHHPRFVRDVKERLVDVALATAAAPTYFATQVDKNGIPLVDGGTWANNPVTVGIVEAIGILEWERTSLDVLSVGCTESTLNLNTTAKNGGLLAWGMSAADFLMAAQSAGALAMAQVLLGDNLHRVNVNVPKGRFNLDGVKEIAALKGLGYDSGRRKLACLTPVFFNSPAVNDFLPGAPT